MIRQICPQNRLAYYDDVSSGLHTFRHGRLYRFHHFRHFHLFVIFVNHFQVVHQFSSAYQFCKCPPFTSCPYTIVWLFCLQSFSWGMLALISDQTDLSSDLVIRAGCCTFATGALTQYVYHGPSSKYSLNALRS